MKLRLRCDGPHSYCVSASHLESFIRSACGTPNYSITADLAVPNVRSGTNLIPNYRVTAVGVVLENLIHSGVLPTGYYYTL